MTTTVTYGRCEFCASKGYERRKLITSPAGPRCSACMNLVNDSDREAERESMRRIQQREEIALKLAAERYADGVADRDDLDLAEWDEKIATSVDSVDGGYWVAARVWVPMEDVEDALFDNGGPGTTDAAWVAERDAEEARTTL